MKYILKGTFLGLSNINLQFDKYLFDDNMYITKTYAHMMSPFILAFSPAEPGKAHPAPWKPALGGISHDITAEIFIPETIFEKDKDPLVTLSTIVALLRIYVNPKITAPVLSNISFASAAKAADNEILLTPYESNEVCYSIVKSNDHSIETSELDWIKDNWKNARNLTYESPELQLCFDAMTYSFFTKNPTSALVSIWGALEALFSPAKAELRFRVSALIASFLEDPGKDRVNRQKQIAKLYDARSKAAHGTSKKDLDAYVNSMQLLREVIIKIIESNSIPTMDQLNDLLFGATES